MPTDGGHVGYQVIGDGPLDIVFVPSWASKRRCDVGRAVAGALVFDVGRIQRGEVDPVDFSVMRVDHAIGCIVVRSRHFGSRGRVRRRCGHA
jgi:hypothetical protein